MKGIMNRRTTLLACLILCFTLLSLIGPGSSAYATNLRPGLSLAPLVYEIAENPGKEFEKEVRVTNVTDEAMLVTLEVDDFVAGGEHGEPKILTGKDSAQSSWSLKKWIEAPITSLVLEPKEERVFHYKVKIPENAEPGGHYAVVRFTAAAPQLNQRSGAAISGSVGQLVLLRVKGQIDATGAVESFFTGRMDKDQPTQSWFFETKPVNFFLKFKNEGNVHFKPKGTIAISGFLTGDHRVEIQPATVLPKSKRAFEAVWKSAPAIGVYKATATMTFEGKTEKSETINFIIFPWKIGLIVFAVLLLVIYFLIRQYRLSKKVKDLAKENRRSRRRRSEVA